MTLLPLGTRLIINEIDDFGSTVTLRVVTDDSYSKWGDATESTADTANIKSFVQVLNQDDDLVAEGIFQNGDKVFWFKPDQASLDRGNRIIHNSLEYEIVERVEHESSDVIYILEIRTKKV